MSHIVASRCTACPHACNVNRTSALGRCNSGQSLRIAMASIHMWEEPPISGTRGSGTIFMSGCNLACKFCQNYSLSHECYGVDITPCQLSEIMRMLHDKGAHNINLVTPSHYAYQIIRALDIYRPPIPICYNTSSYDSATTLAALNGYVDIYLADLKYMTSAIAEELSGCSDYPAIATTAIKTMRSQVPDTYNSQDIMTSGLIVRHLVLPNNLANTKACLEYIATDIGTDCSLSLMSQYTPCGNGLPLAINRPLRPIEYKVAVSMAAKLGFTSCYTQEMTSATVDYVPDFVGGKVSVMNLLDKI